MRRIIPALVAGLALLTLVSMVGGCNTVKGVARDLESAATGIARLAADEQ